MSPLSAPPAGSRSSRLRASRFCATKPSSSRSSSRWAAAQPTADDAVDRAHDHAQDRQRHQGLEQREAGFAAAGPPTRSRQAAHGDPAGQPVDLDRPPSVAGRQHDPAAGRGAVGEEQQARPRPSPSSASSVPRGSRGTIAAAVTVGHHARAHRGAALVADRQRHRPGGPVDVGPQQRRAPAAAPPPPAAPRSSAPPAARSA